MQVIRGPVAVVFTEDDAAVLARQFGRALQLAYGAPGRPAPPERLLDFARQLSEAAGSAGSAQNPRSAPGAEPDRFRTGQFLPLSAQPETLTVTEAAGAAEVSTGYMRRLIRRGDVTASRDRRSAYLVNTASLVQWASGRRKERAQKAA